MYFNNSVLLSVWESKRFETNNHKKLPFSSVSKPTDAIYYSHADCGTLHASNINRLCNEREHFASVLFLNVISSVNLYVIQFNITRNQF